MTTPTEPVDIIDVGAMITAIVSPHIQALDEAGRTGTATIIITPAVRDAFENHIISRYLTGLEEAGLISQDWTSDQILYYQLECGHDVGTHLWLLLDSYGLGDDNEPDQTDTGTGDPMAEVHGLSFDDTMRSIDEAIRPTPPIPPGTDR